MKLIVFIFFATMSIMFVANIGFLALNTYIFMEEHTDIIDEEYLLGHMSCDSDSMGQTFGCNDKLYGETLHINDTLVLGDVYVYNASGSKVSHRLVYILDNETLVFKGDNNKMGEKVNRVDVLQHITKVEYN